MQMMKLIWRGAAAGVFLLAVACQTRAVDPEVRIDGKLPSEMYADPQVVALVEAILKQDGVRVAELARNGANVNADPSGGAVPLMWASQVRCNDCLAALLEAGADPWLKMDKSGQGAIELIVGRGDRPEQLPIFLAAGLDPNHPVSNSRDVSLLGIAAFNGPLDSVQVLVKAGADVNYHGAFYMQDAVGEALAGGRFDAAYYLLEHGYQPNVQELAKGVQARKVDPSREADRQRVIAWLKKRGAVYPPDPNNDP